MQHLQITTSDGCSFCPGIDLPGTFLYTGTGQIPSMVQIQILCYLIEFVTSQLSDPKSHQHFKIIVKIQIYIYTGTK